MQNAWRGSGSALFEGSLPMAEGLEDKKASAESTNEPVPVGSTKVKTHGNYGEKIGFYHLLSTKNGG